MKENKLAELSMDFAVEIVNLVRELRSKHENVIANQIGRSGTSIGANIHDNDKWHDSHRLPFTMDIDFLPIVKALKEIGYQGEFTLEVDHLLADYGPERIDEGVGVMAEAARRLATLYEEA